MIKDLEKRIFIVQKYFETGSCTLVQRQWKLKFKEKSAPSYSIITSMVLAFKKNGCLNKEHKIERGVTKKRQEAKKSIKIQLSANPSLPLRILSQSNNISPSLARTIAKQDLGLKSMKATYSQELFPPDYEKRVDFANYFKKLSKNTSSHLIISNEVYFYSTASINEQNDRFWSKTKAYSGIEKPLHDPKFSFFVKFPSKKIMDHTTSLKRLPVPITYICLKNVFCLYI
jgi:hypothetical protein